ncbi:hypothetical protein [Levilactobacillus zymae]|uniref:hypothetical protein n=1 Tax=Levilactobacillus zymae TaxID=267363 RepID=UPI001265FA39|nr:hypothetical protein [Levilactobacillus zymae]QFR60709.1 hypothetical protein LZ395_03835 [Levilactobacillus zymae]
MGLITDIEKIMAMISQLTHLSPSKQDKIRTKVKDAKTVAEKESIINEAKDEDQIAAQQEKQVPSIVQAPSFTFADCPVSENAVTTPLQSNPATPSTLEVQASQSQKWRVEVSLSAFQLQETSQRPVPTLSGAAIQLGSKDQAAGGARTLLTANSVSGLGNQSIDLSSTTLSLPPVAYAGRYQARLTYTLIVDGS